MHKIIILIICFFGITNQSNAIFGEANSLDLYKNIDKGINELNSKMIYFELEGGEKQTGILKEINELALFKGKPACLDEKKEISKDEFYKIVNEDNISELQKYTKSENDCKNNIELITDYIKLFKEYEKEKKEVASIKVDKMYKLSNIGLYSDGDINNSGFDLIKDIEDIDKIIFANVIPYVGEESKNLDEKLNKYLGNIEEKMEKLRLNSNIDKQEEKKSPPISENINNELKNNIIIKPENNYLCKEDLDNSLLNKEALEFLENSINNNINNGENNQSNPNNNNNNSNDNLDNGKNNDLNFGNYNKVTDNSEWPCETFFCINVDFIMYEHNLFGGGEDITIEYLLNRSNEHLKRFASTSLIPAKMSTNNFELGLKDLNLPDIFHIGIQISTKPVPILDIERIGQQDESEYSTKNMLEQYYKSNGLDYKRRNDLSLLKKVEFDKQAKNGSEELNIQKAIEKNKDFKEYFNSEKNKINLLNKSINKSVLSKVSETFNTQFAEIERFTFGINDYVKNLQSIIESMNKIPEGS